MHIEGSYSREVGSHLAISRSGSVAGNLADGCLEAELANQSAQAAIEGCARIVRYGKGSPFIDLRLPCGAGIDILVDRSEEQTSELQSLMRYSYAVFCLQKKNNRKHKTQ